MELNPNEQAAADLRARLDYFVRRRVREPADAEDLLHDIFVKLLSHPGPRQATRLLPWAYAVARNQVADFYRKRRRMVAVADEPTDDSGWPDDGEPPDLRHALRSLLTQLSSDDQEILQAVELDGLSQKAYAEARGLNYATVKSRLQRARRRLRRAFDQCCEIVLDRRNTPIACTPRAQSGCCDDGNRARRGLSASHGPATGV